MRASKMSAAAWLMAAAISPAMAKEQTFNTLGDYIIPKAFSRALSQGMKVPVYLKFVDSQDAPGQQKIADAIVSVDKQGLFVKEIELVELKDNTELAIETKNIVKAMKDTHFDADNKIAFSSDAVLNLDIKSFQLVLDVSQKALTAVMKPRSSLLGEADVTGLSSVLTYAIGSYYNQYRATSSSRTYVTLDNTTSKGEHHFNLNGSLYGGGSSDLSGKWYRAMYERDYAGRRFAAGMVDTWNLQSITSLDTLNSGKIYGASYGNKASTKIENNTLSLTPITVFLPAAGEVHVLRDGKLLSIQNFSMGSYEIDTSRLPYGVYPVVLEVVVNGRMVSSRSAMINKAFSRSSAEMNQLAWQFFGGSLQYNKIDYRRNYSRDYGQQTTWLAGVAGAINFPLLSGLAMKSSLYGFDQNGVSETEANLAISEQVSLNSRVMVSNNRSWRNVSTVNLQIPAGYGSLWISRDKSSIQQGLPVEETDYLAAGATLNLNQLVNRAGLITLSRTNNRHTGNEYTTFDYSTNLASTRYGTIGLRAGVQRYNYTNNANSDLTEKYISLDFSLPLGKWLSAGISSENGSKSANLTARKQFNDGLIRSVGASVSKRLDGGNSHADNYAISGFTNYISPYNSGTVSVNRSSDASTNVNFSSMGSVAWSGGGVGFSHEKQRAGVMIKTGLKDDGDLAAKINGKTVRVSGKGSYISLPPYARYHIEFMNDKNSEDSFDIVDGRQSSVTLYPGNVGLIQPTIKKMVTVFGRVKYPSGAIAANQDIHNHIGRTRTNEEGEFSMDIDTHYPVLTLTDSSGARCEADLQLDKAKGAIWVGDVNCVPQQVTASR